MLSGTTRLALPASRRALGTCPRFAGTRTWLFCASSAVATRSFAVCWRRRGIIGGLLGALSGGRSCLVAAGRARAAGRGSHLWRGRGCGARVAEWPSRSVAPFACRARTRIGGKGWTKDTSGPVSAASAGLPTRSARVGYGTLEETSPVRATWMAPTPSAEPSTSALGVSRRITSGRGPPQR